MGIITYDLSVSRGRGEGGALILKVDVCIGYDTCLGFFLSIGIFLILISFLRGVVIIIIVK